MSGIDDLLGGFHDKSRVVDRAKMSKKALLIHHPEGDEGRGDTWIQTWHNMTLKDLAYCIAILQATFDDHLREQQNDD